MFEMLSKTTYICREDVYYFVMYDRQVPDDRDRIYLHEGK